MKWSFSIGRIAGIDVRIHLTFLLLLAWFAIWNWQASGDTGQVMSAMIFILALFACVVMHEFGHALVARRFGVATRSITLLPIGGVASMERMPENPLHEIAVAIAGPMVNFAIALVIYLLMPADSIVAMPQAGPDVDGSAELPGGTSLAGQLLFINLVLGVFNLLPAFPMDGGRVLRALLSLFMPSLRATRLAASIGQGLALALGLLGLLGNPFLILIAVFVWIGAAGEAGYAEMKSAISSVPVTRAMLTEYETVHEYDSLGHVADLTLKGSQKDFPVVRGDEVIGVVTQEDLLRGLREAGEIGVVAGHMSGGVGRATPDESLEEVVERLRDKSCRLIAVTDGGQTIGIVNYDNLIELIMLNRAMRRDDDLPR